MVSVVGWSTVGFRSNKRSGTCYKKPYIGLLDIVGIRRSIGACLKQEQSNQSKDPTGLVLALFELLYLKGSND